MCSTLSLQYWGHISLASPRIWKGAGALISYPDLEKIIITELCLKKFLLHAMQGKIWSEDNRPQRIAKNEQLDSNTVGIDHCASAQYL